MVITLSLLGWVILRNLNRGGTFFVCLLYVAIVVR